MAHKSPDWSLRSCSWHGHETYAPDEPDLRERLRGMTGAGEVWRCLRCEAFVLGPPSGSGPADDAPPVPRGRALRDRVILRALALERALRALVLTGAGVLVLRFSGSRDAIQRAYDQDLPLLRPLARQLGWNLEGSRVLRWIEASFTTSTSTIVLVGLALLAYAAAQLLEAVGLWLARRWGEYFAVVATSLFLPLEIYELTERFTVVRLVLLAVNVAAVVWLLVSKHLFGVRGGRIAYETERHEASLLTVERAALDAATA